MTATAATTALTATTASKQTTTTTAAPATAGYIVRSGSRIIIALKRVLESLGVSIPSCKARRQYLLTL